MNQNTEVADNSDQAQKKSGSSRIFVDLVVCMLIPTLILKKLSGDDMLGPNYALIAALSLPLLVGLWGFISERKIGFVPALGFISILLTGSIGILKLPKEYIAYKEALIPGLIAIATVVSTYTKYPLVRTFLYNDTFMDTNKVSTILAERPKTAEFDSMMVKATWLLASSFVLSSVLNFLLAKWIVVSESGTDAFNNELGTMNLYSYPVIVVPCMVITMFAMFYVFSNIKKLTGLKIEELVQQ
ncbi:MAG: MFS transporter [Arenicella sp.]|nr:MFS transporter [Arenicella sp.]